jgi:hypothetical protein
LQIFFTVNRNFLNDLAVTTISRYYPDNVLAGHEIGSSYAEFMLKRIFIQVIRCLCDTDPDLITRIIFDVVKL